LQAAKAPKRPHPKRQKQRAEGQRGRGAEGQRGRVAEWQSGRVAEWQSGRVAEGQRGEGRGQRDAHALGSAPLLRVRYRSRCKA
jgi:hypothetical protein